MEKLNVGLFTYDIGFYDDIRDHDGGQLYGIITYEDHNIRIMDGLPEMRKRMTLLHEIIHANNEYYGLGFDEVKNQQVATMFFEFIVKNKEIVKYLMGEE